MTANGRDLSGRAEFEPNTGTTVSVAEVRLTAQDGSRFVVRDDALLTVRAGETLVAGYASYTPPVSAPFGPYGRRQAVIEVTEGADGVLGGEFGFTVSTSGGLFFNDEIRVRGAFRTAR